MDVALCRGGHAPKSGEVFGGILDLLCAFPCPRKILELDRIERRVDALQAHDGGVGTLCGGDLSRGDPLRNPGGIQVAQGVLGECVHACHA